MLESKKSQIYQISIVYFKKNSELVDIDLEFGLFKHIYSFSKESRVILEENVKDNFKIIPNDYEKRSEKTIELIGREKGKIEFIHGMFLCDRMMGSEYSIQNAFACLKDMKSFFTYKKVNNVNDLEKITEEDKYLVVEKIEKKPIDLIIENKVTINFDQEEPISYNFGKCKWNKSPGVFNTQDTNIEKCTDTIRKGILKTLSKSLTFDVDDKNLKNSLDIFKEDERDNFLYQSKYRPMEDIVSIMDEKYVEKDNDALKLKIFWDVSIDGKKILTRLRNDYKTIEKTKSMMVNDKAVIETHSMQMELQRAKMKADDKKIISQLDTIKKRESKIRKMEKRISKKSYEIASLKREKRDWNLSASMKEAEIKELNEEIRVVKKSSQKQIKDVIIQKKEEEKRMKEEVKMIKNELAKQRSEIEDLLTLNQEISPVKTSAAKEKKISVKENEEITKLKWQLNKQSRVIEETNKKMEKLMLMVKMDRKKRKEEKKQHRLEIGKEEEKRKLAMEKIKTAVKFFNEAYKLLDR